MSRLSIVGSFHFFSLGNLLNFKLKFSSYANELFISSLYVQDLDFGSPHLKATFDAIIEAFLFLDKNGDGKLNKKDMTNALNDDSQYERSPTHITRTRFSKNFTFGNHCHANYRSSS